MPRERLEGLSRVAAYQVMQLAELRSLFERLDFDLEEYFGLESRIEEESLRLEQTEFDHIRRILASQGTDVSTLHHADGLDDTANAGQEAKGKGYNRVEVESVEDFRQLVSAATIYLAKSGVELDRDPLLQVLDYHEISSITDSYKKRFGGISWDESDYLIVMLAGLLGTLLDVFLVRIPADTRFLGKLQPGSLLTRWLKENSKPVYEHFLSRLEDVAKVPYDDSVGRLVERLSPKVHRLMSPAHDPVLGFILGVIDIISGTGTFIDKHGNLVRIDKALSPEGLIVAFLKVFLHLLSDVCTRAGIQPPFFTLLQLVKTRSPFVLGSSGETVLWTDVARYMYVHGYDLRHFATMGIVPATIEMTIRGWWLLRNFASEEDTDLARAKIASMLMLGHTIAASGTLLKTGLVFGMNPLALNWAQILALFPVTISWVRESVRRDRSVRKALDAQWVHMYRTARA